MLSTNQVLGITAFSPDHTHKLDDTRKYAAGNSDGTYFPKAAVPLVERDAPLSDSAGFNRVCSMPLDYGFMIPLVAPTEGTAAMTIMSMAGPPASASTTYFVWDGEDILVETHGSDTVWIN